MNKAALLRQAEYIDNREKLFYSELVKYINSLCKPFKYTSGLVRGNNHVNENSYHRLYKLTKPIEFSFNDGSVYKDSIIVLGSNFFMTEDGGMGSPRYTDLTKIQLIRLAEHIEKDIKL